jgi:hypothetical protein
MADFPTVRVGNIHCSLKLFVKPSCSKELHEFDGVIRLDPSSATIDSVLPFLGSLAIDEDSHLDLAGGGDRLAVEIPLVKTQDVGMEEIHDLVNIRGIEGLGHQRPIGTEFLDLMKKVGVFGPKHHVLPHVVTLDGGDEILR